MKRILIPALAFLCLVPGCRKNPAPEALAQAFYQLCDIGRQQGFDAVQMDIYGMLSEDSRKMLETRAKTLNERLDPSPPIEPYECLAFSSFEGSSSDFEAARLAEGDRRVRLEIASNGTARFIEFVNEDGGWKIDLPATLELNRGRQ